MTDIPICGAWRLVSFEIINPQGERRPWGDQAHGTLLYTPDGWMLASINRAIEPTGSEDPDAILDSCLFYAGPYELHATELLHFVAEANDPHRIGKTLTRYPEWDGTTLRLTSPPQPWGTAVICWRKLGT
jgi:Lipocalin-like domain